MHTCPILLIDDDAEDLDLISEAFIELNVPNQILRFSEAQDALDFLSATDKQPFLILCDINMHGMNGMELRQKVYDNENLRKKSIPFLFLSTGGSLNNVSTAYQMSVQGYFIKPSSFEQILEMVRNILAYWQTCFHPNTRGLRNV